MKFKCTECGFDECYQDSGKYICKWCGKQYTFSEVKDSESKSVEEITQFKEKVDNYIDDILNPKKPISDISNDEIIEKLKLIENIVTNSNITSQRNFLAIKDSFEQQTETLTDILVENIEKLPLREAAKDENIEKLKNYDITYLIDNAKDNDGLTAPACFIRGNVEKNLSTKFNLQHYGPDFVMKLSDFNDYIKNYTNENNKHPFLNYICKTVFDDKNNIRYAIISPLIRFTLIGLPYKKALKANEYWKTTNYFIHRSPECLEKSEELCNKGMDYARSYFKDMLKFFKENGLYDRD